jgi:hypothetical protein
MAKVKAGEGSAPEASAPAQPGARIDWSAILPGVLFVLIVGTGAVFYFNAQAEQRQERQQQAMEVQELGLPQGFPLEVVPLYPGLQITKSEVAAAESQTGLPMDHWTVHGTTPDNKQAVFDFYKAKLLAADMSQTQYISIPTGFAVNYGREDMTVELEIEKLDPQAKVTDFRMNVYRLR